MKGNKVGKNIRKKERWEKKEWQGEKISDSETLGTLYRLTVYTSTIAVKTILAL